MLAKGCPEPMVKWLDEKMLAVCVEVQRTQETRGREVTKPEERAATNIDHMRMSPTTIEDALHKFEAVCINFKKTAASDVKQLEA